MLVRSVLLTALLLLTLSLVTHDTVRAGCRDDLPEWVTDRREDSPLFLYEIGEASGRATLSEARASALRDAARRFLTRMSIAIGRDSASAGAVSGLLEGLEVVPDAEFTCSGMTHDAWLLVRLPRTAFVAEVARRKRPMTLWGSARGAFLASEQATSPAARISLERKGRDSLQTLIAEYPVGKQNLFETESALLLLAEREIQANEPCRARDRLREILAVSRDAGWTAQAGRRLDSVHCDDEQAAREALRVWFGGGVTTIAACFETDGVPIAFTALQSRLGQFLGGLRLETVTSDCSSQSETAAARIEVRLHGTEQPHADGIVYSGLVRTRVVASGHEVFTDEFPVRAPGPDSNVLRFRMAKAIMDVLEKRWKAIVSAR